MLKKSIIFFSLLCSVMLAEAQHFPDKSNTLVTDYTATLAAADKQTLESKLVAFADSTSTQIAVVLIKTAGSLDLEDYGTGLAKAWGIGQKGKNNGVLILVAIIDHKVTIRTGWGAEGAISDKTAADIIHDDMYPRFKQNDFYGGLDAATSHIMQLIKNDYTADAPAGQRSGSGNGTGILVIIVIVVIVLIIIFRRRGGGGGGQIISGRGSASPFWWFLGGSLLGGGIGSNWGSGWGNDNNNNGGGDSGGGDFGGFGGGDFGGGGASGSW